MIKNIKYIRILAFLVLIAFTASAYAQHRKRHKDHRAKKLEMLIAKKNSFISNHIKLSPEEAQKFWPVYNEFNKKLHEIRNIQRKNYVKLFKRNETATDKEIEAGLDGYFVFLQNEIDIKKEYHLKFKKILSPRKLARYYDAEEKFKRKMLRKLHHGKKRKGRNR